LDNVLRLLLLLLFASINSNTFCSVSKERADTDTRADANKAEESANDVNFILVTMGRVE
jgi:hypothetical protein